MRSLDSRAAQGDQWLDPDRRDDRALLIAAAHPELDTEAETALVEGHDINPRLHLTIHEIVATQIVDDDPPEVWKTAQRLRELGYGRHEILHMLARRTAQPARCGAPP